MTNSAPKTEVASPGQTAAAPQPLGRFLKIADVVEETTLSRATIYRMIAAGDFPAPTRIGIQRVVWPSSLIEAWKQRQFCALSPLIKGGNSRGIGPIKRHKTQYIRGH